MLESNNPFIKIFNSVTQALLLNLGATAAIAAAEAEAPWLNLPIISGIFSWFVNTLAQSLTTVIEQNGDALIVQLQDSVKLVEYNNVIAPYKNVLNNPGASSADKQMALTNAKAAIDSIVKRP